MYIRTTGIFAWVAAAIVLATGCKKSETPEPQTATNTNKNASNEPAAVVHWVGIKHLATDPSAAGFLKIWRLPESQNLTTQTLDKLALAPWRLSGTNILPAVTNYAPLLRQNASASLLRPLLDDLIQEECYLEVTDANDRPGQFALALRLPPERAGLWETNLASVVTALTGGQVTVQSNALSSGWRVQSTNSSLPCPIGRQIEFARARDWTVVGLTADQNTLFADLLGRLAHDQTPFISSLANTNWIDANVDLRRLSVALCGNSSLPQDWPRALLVVNGDGQNVSTRCNLQFPKPLAFDVEPWNIPTNLMHEPLHSFTAVQGVKSWVSSLHAWQTLKISSTPNQLFFWAQPGTPFLDFAAAPVQDAANAMTKIGPALMDDFNPLLATNRMGKWERAANSDGVVWNRAPIISPFVHSTALPEGQFIFAGLTPPVVTNTPSPSGTIQDLLSNHEVIFFDSELTGPRLEAWLYTSQLLRVIFRREQLPEESLAASWFKSIGPLLGPSKTTALKTGPASISATRVSTMGLTAIELHILVDWLESSRFPVQLHTVTAKLPPLPARRPAPTAAPNKQ